jgi:hypothetical protein
MPSLFELLADAQFHLTGGGDGKRDGGYTLDIGAGCYDVDDALHQLRRLSSAGGSFENVGRVEAAASGGCARHSHFRMKSSRESFGLRFTRCSS